MASLRESLVASLRHRVLQLLAPREAWLPPVASALAQVRDEAEVQERRARASERALTALRDEVQLWSRPFGPDLTVHQAWIRHPRAREVFARYHLPACDHCAVRFDETVGEACAAYGLDPLALVKDLNGLLSIG